MIIDHGNGLETLYAHMSRIHVREGEAIGRADQIGEVGSTGRSVGPHLHYEIHENGVKVNPLKHYLSRKTLNDNRRPPPSVRAVSSTGGSGGSTSAAPSRPAT